MSKERQVDFGQLRGNAMVQHTVPPGFADWPRGEQQELLVLARLSCERTKLDVDRLAKQKPRAKTGLQRNLGKLTLFVREIEAVMQCEA